MPEISKIDISDYDEHTDFQQLYLSQLNHADNSSQQEIDGSCVAETCSITITAQISTPTLVFAKFSLITPLGIQIFKHFEKLIVPC